MAASKYCKFGYAGMCVLNAFECAFISFESSLLAFEKCSENVQCFSGCGVWMTKEFVDFEKCGHCMHFVWKQWKIIHSLVRIDFCIAEYVNSFENGGLYWTMLVSNWKKKL